MLGGNTGGLVGNFPYWQACFGTAGKEQQNEGRMVRSKEGAGRPSYHILLSVTGGHNFPRLEFSSGIPVAIRNSITPLIIQIKNIRMLDSGASYRRGWEATLKLFLALLSMPLYLIFFCSSFVIPYLPPTPRIWEKHTQMPTLLSHYMQKLLWPIMWAIHCFWDRLSHWHWVTLSGALSDGTSLPFSFTPYSKCSNYKHAP